ncbi:MAG: hypothetical protein A49_18320 [Methyloceanibacter sp.]|nr:MAG: hypothetical protein A49_18320 [Methyloceanibacter sp.]
MPRGPKGEKRPTDVIGAAVTVARIATGEIEESLEVTPAKNEAAAEMGRKGGAMRAKTLTPEQRSEIARKGALARWKTGQDNG